MTQPGTRYRPAMMIRPALFSLLAAVFAGTVWACPFCPPTQSTFAEELAAADVAVIAVEVREVAKAGAAKAPPKKNALLAVLDPVKFRIVEVLKGSELLGKATELETLHLERKPAGTKFYITGRRQENASIEWASPIAVSDKTAAYLKQVVALPADSLTRLTFFHTHLEDAEPTLARDAYDEFAKSPYETVQALKPQMNRVRLLAWVHDAKVPEHHRRLYLTMLGVCGGKEELAAVEQLLVAADRDTAPILDALVGSYLVLRGPQGVDLIERKYLANPKAEQSDVWSTVQALRIVGEISDAVPRQRLILAFRRVVEAQPERADMVIADLARWQDWESMERLVALFKAHANDKGPDSLYLRVPVLRYLMACPKPEAKAHLDTLARLDPAAMKQARSGLPSVRSGGVVEKSQPPAAPPPSGD